LRNTHRPEELVVSRVLLIVAEIVVEQENVEGCAFVFQRLLERAEHLVVFTEAGINPGLNNVP
jgi:hypothetical protein